MFIIMVQVQMPNETQLKRGYYGQMYRTEKGELRGRLFTDPKNDKVQEFREIDNAIAMAGGILKKLVTPRIVSVLDKETKRCLWWQQKLLNLKGGEYGKV